MKTIHRTLQRLALAALAATGFLSQAEAAPVVSIFPASQTIGVNGTATVDIIVSGLTPTTTVGGFSLTLGFNNTFLSGTSFLVDPGGVMGGGILDLSQGFGFPGPSSLDLFVLADQFADQTALALSEGASFTLAAVTFKGLSDGLSPVTLTGAFGEVNLSNFDGSATLAGVSHLNGEICVGAVGATCATNPVPEPATMLLVATGLGALAMRRRRAA